MDAVEKVRNLEVELTASRKEAAKALRTARADLKLTLRQVASRVRLSAVTIHSIERNKSWKTRTAQRIARCYSNAV